MLMPGFDMVIVIVCGAAFFGILGGILLHKIVGWYVEGAMGGLQCLLISGLYAGLILSIVTLQVAVALCIVAAGVILFVVSTSGEHEADRRFRDEQMEAFRRAIAADPANLAARTRLANALYADRKLDEAIAELTEVVRRSPQSIPEAHRLKRFLAEKEEQQAPPVTCPSCGQRNPPDRTHCTNCEGFLRPSSELKRWLMTGGLKQIIIAWSVTMAVIAVIMLFLSMLSVAGRIVVIAVFLIVVILAELLHVYRSI